MAEVVEESEETRLARVKELEEIVKKLESENRQLLNKVQSNSPTHKHKQIAGELQRVQDESSGAKNLRNGGKKMSRGDSVEDDLIDLEEGEGEEPPADEWLFVSPKLPPTPVQKKMSPLQWLSEGHTHKRDGEVPSLSDVRKTLVFGMNEAENLVRVIPGAESPPISPQLRAKQPANRTAQKYLDQVRQRRNSPPSVHSPSGGSPLLGARSMMETTTQVQQMQNSNSVPIVRWKAKVPPDTSPTFSDEEEQIPVVKWKVRQVLSENIPAMSGRGDDNLRVKWNPAMAGQFSSDEDEIPERGGGIGVENGIPVVKWKAKLPQDTKSGGDVPVVKWKAKVPKSNNDGGDVPVVKWKARVPAEPKAQEEDVPVVRWKAKVPAEPQEEDVPVVRWKAKVPAEQNEDVPVVRWKAKVPAEPQEEDVPVVRWKAKVPAEPQEEDVPVVRWKAKVPAEPEVQEEDVPVVRWKAKVPNSGGMGSPNQKRGMVSPRGKGRGLAPPSRRAAAARDDSENSEGGAFTGDSENSGSDVSTENLRVSRLTAHQSGLQRRSPGTSTSRSPKAHHSPLAGGSRSRSPSPSTKQPRGSSSRLQNSHISRSGLAPPRQGGASLRNLSPSSQGSNTSPASVSRSPSSSPGGGLRAPRRQLQGASSSPNQRKLSPSGLSRSANHSSAAQQSRGLQAPRSTQNQQQQRTLGVVGSVSAPARSGLTPSAGQGGKGRRVLPNPPSATNGGPAQQQRVRQAASQGTPTKRMNQQIAKPRPQAREQQGDMGDDDDSWLEGCF